MDVRIVVEAPDDGGEELAVAGRFSRLPEPVHLADTITSAETVVRSGPDLQRDPEVDFMIRYGLP